jgi:hypothetical protein
MLIWQTAQDFSDIPLETDEMRYILRTGNAFSPALFPFAGAGLSQYQRVLS